MQFNIAYDIEKSLKSNQPTPVPDYGLYRLYKMIYFPETGEYTIEACVRKSPILSKLRLYHFILAKTDKL